MKIIFSHQFVRKLEKLGPVTQRKFQKQLSFLLYDIQHPSLHAKKYDETNDVWQARIDKKYRFYFKIENSSYKIVDVRQHSD